MSEPLKARVLRHLAASTYLPAGTIAEALGEPVTVVEAALRVLIAHGDVREIAGAPGLFEAVNRTADR